MLIDEIWNECVAFKIQQKKLEFCDLLEEIVAKDLTNFGMDIGCYNGGTTIAFSLLTKKLISCDMVKRFDDAMMKRNCDYEYINGDTHSQELIDTINSKIPPNSLDYIFIDGDHTADGAMLDFINFKHLVKPNGIAIFHDILDCNYHHIHNCYVDVTWNKLKSKYNHREIIHEVDPYSIEFPISTWPSDGKWAGIGIIYL